MSIKLDKSDLEGILAGENEAKLTKVKQVEKEINGVPKKVIKFYFKVNDEVLVEEAIRYVKGDSKLRNYLEGMTGQRIEDLLNQGFDLSSMVGKRFLVEIEKNESQKTQRIFNNVEKIKGEIEGSDAGDEILDNLR